VLRESDPQTTIWELLLPEEAKRLPVELAQVDAYLDDERFIAPWRALFDQRLGRPSVPIDTLLRLLYLKHRYGLGYESLCREVSDSISWRRFCRIGLDRPVPHPTTLVKLVRRAGVRGPRPRQGWAAYGYTHRLGYHPLLASRADTGELLHLRMRTGSANTARGAERFVNELAGRVRRAGAAGPLTLRGDSGFWSAKVIAACRRHGIGFSITVRQTKLVKAAIAAIGEDAWTDIDYPDGGPPRWPTRPLLARQAVADRAPHPPGRRAGDAVAGLAPPRVHHQPVLRPGFRPQG
jgi:hypothetical protein